MHTLLKQQITDPKELDVYLPALELLKKSYIQVGAEGNPCEASVGLLWFNVVPTEYLTALTLRQPVALILLAYYCVLLQQIDVYWYVKGWGIQLIDAVQRSIPPSLHTWTEWPIRYVKLFPTL